MELMKLLELLNAEGIPASLSFEGGKQVISISSGFYKSEGFAYICRVDGKLMLHTRYDRISEIDDVADVVAESFDWWKYSRDRHSGWKQPHPDWLSLYTKYKWIDENGKER